MYEPSKTWDAWSGPSKPSVPVAVIVPTYNRAGLLGEALQSLLAQSVQPNRILVIDDGSTDNTAKVARSVGAQVEYRATPNDGKASALNLGLSLIRDPLIWIFNEDDIAAPDALEVLVRTLEANPNCGFACGAYDNFGADPKTGKLVRVSPDLPRVAPEGLFPALLERCFVVQGAMLVRRSSYEAVGPFDESLAHSQDHEMLLRLARRFPGALTDKVVLHQRKQLGPRGTAKSRIRHAEMEAAWRNFDRQIFLKLRETLGLEEYLPRGVGGLAGDDDARIFALVQRFTVFARKDMWPEAEEDFVALAALAEQSGRLRLTAAEYVMLTRVFDGFSRGLTSFLQAEDFHATLARMKPASLRTDICAALVTPMSYRLRHALIRQRGEEAMQLIGIIHALGGPRSMLTWLWRKLTAG